LVCCIDQDRQQLCAERERQSKAREADRLKKIRSIKIDFYSKQSKENMLKVIFALKRAEVLGLNFLHSVSAIPCASSGNGAFIATDFGVELTIEAQAVSEKTISRV
jgi:hypothetical protein